jgi:sulfur carrier protein
MLLTINGEKKNIDSVETLADVLAILGIDAATKGIAVALNDTVVPRVEWKSTRLQDGGTIEIIRAVQGG